MLKAVIAIAFLLSSSALYSQKEVYNHFGIGDGLPSETVYYVMQDSKGFIWFGTDEGLCCYDGTTFSTFTTDDGLPDNEVFRISEDSQGRIWPLCYSAVPCYIQNQRVCQVRDGLPSLNALSFPREICPDLAGGVWILYENKVTGIGIGKLHRTQIYDVRDPVAVGTLLGKRMLITLSDVYAVSDSGDGPSLALLYERPQAEKSAAVFTGSGAYIIDALEGGGSAVSKIDGQGLHILARFDYPIEWSHNVFSQKDSSLILYSRELGHIRMDSYGNKGLNIFPALPTGRYCTYACIDEAGNTWISTLGKGVYCVPVNRVASYENFLGKPSIRYSVYKMPDKRIMTGGDRITLDIIKDNSHHKHKFPVFLVAGMRVSRIKEWNGLALIGTDQGVYLMNGKNEANRVSRACAKAFAIVDSSSFIAATVSGAFKFNRRGSLYHVDTIWQERTTAVAVDGKQTVWLGTLNGLFFADGVSATVRYGKSERLAHSRITDISIGSPSCVLVATHQNGVFAVSKDTAIQITRRNGLPSNSCIRIANQGDTVFWVSTNKGLAKICRPTNSMTFQVVDYSNASLRIGAINDMYIDSNEILLATHTGLFKLALATVVPAVPPRVVIKSFMAGDSIYPTQGARLPYLLNNIKIDFVAPFYSGRPVMYKYVISGSRDTIYTAYGNVNFTGLSPGNYEVHVWPSVLEGQWAVPTSLSFEVLAPFWATWWFRTAAALCIILAIFSFLYWRLSVVGKRDRERQSLNRQIMEVELLASKAQMNEHFIFNSLSSIQAFINGNDLEAANLYLHHFGKLIRRTLDIATLSDISLDEEIDYLQTYLQLEQMRYPGKFEWLVTKKVEDANEIHIPSMVIQPHIENAIRHGLRHRKGGGGILKVDFASNEQGLVCTIEDNGVGRKAALLYRSPVHVEYQSKGSILSADKINLYNKLNGTDVHLSITDKIDAMGQATGTLVTIFIPN